jgi:tellurite methyltransferase
MGQGRNAIFLAQQGWDVTGFDPSPVGVRQAQATAHKLKLHLEESGLLDDWRDGDRPYDVVFQALARFALPEVIQTFRPDEFADALRKTL